MSTFFLHAFLPFLLDWLCCAGAPTVEAADDFFFGFATRVKVGFLCDFVGAMVVRFEASAAGRAASKKIEGCALRRLCAHRLIRRQPVNKSHLVLHVDYAY